MFLPRACHFETRPSPRSKIGRNAGHGKKYGIHRTENLRLIFENVAFCLNSLAFSGRKIHCFSVVFLPVNSSIRSIIR